MPFSSPTSHALLFIRQDITTFEKLKEVCLLPSCPARQRMHRFCNANIGVGFILHLIPGLSEGLLFECKPNLSEGLAGCTDTIWEGET